MRKEKEEDGEREKKNTKNKTRNSYLRRTERNPFCLFPWYPTPFPPSLPNSVYRCPKFFQCCTAYATMRTIQADNLCSLSTAMEGSHREKGRDKNRTHINIVVVKSNEIQTTRQYFFQFAKLITSSSTLSFALLLAHSLIHPLSLSLLLALHCSYRISNLSSMRTESSTCTHNSREKQKMPDMYFYARIH